MLSINSRNSFSRFCSHLNKIIETTSTLYLKKKEKEKKKDKKIVVPKGEGREERFGTLELENENYYT